MYLHSFSTVLSALVHSVWTIFLSQGKGVYQFVKKYGANVDGYSPIYAPEEWSASGDSYVGGAPALTIWATLLGGLLVGGAFLVYSTSALAS
jgi:photosystem II protein